MQNINTWKIDNNLDETNDKFIKHIDDNFTEGDISPTFLLDLTKNKYTFIEKYVYDIAMFHFTRLNIHNTEDHYVEFWFKAQTSANIKLDELHIDCDEALRFQEKLRYPILASVTYLNDSYNLPTIITNVDSDDYNNKRIEKQVEMVLSLPKRNKHITFNGKFYHGCTLLSDHQDTTHVRYILAINFWDKKPTSSTRHCVEYKPSSNSYFNSLFEKNQNVISIQPDNNIGYINVDNTIINYKFFDDILYQSEYNNVCCRFNNLIKKYHGDNNKNINTFKFKLDEQTDAKHQLNANNIPIFIINLKSDINRKLSIINKLEYTNLKNYTIIDAIDGKTDLDNYNFKIMPDWIDPIFKRKINANEIGCFLSHFFIWKHIVTHNLDMVLILEDDCVFLNNFNDKFEQLIDLNAASIYDFFPLGRSKLNEKYNLGPETIIHSDYVIPKYSYNAHSYLLTKSGAKILTNELATKNIIPVDEYLSIMYNSFPFSKYSDHFKHIPKMKAIGLIDNITDQDDFKSNITI